MHCAMLQLFFALFLQMDVGALRFFVEVLDQAVAILMHRGGAAVSPYAPVLSRLLGDGCDGPTAFVRDLRLQVRVQARREEYQGTKAPLLRSPVFCRNRHCSGSLLLV